MKRIEKFAKDVFHHAPTPEESHEQLAEMLKEKVEDLKEQGLTEVEAIDKTIEEFGDVEDYHDPSIDKEKRRHLRMRILIKNKNALLFSALSSALIIGILVLVNFVLFSDHEHLGRPWSLIVALGVLFWPLSLLYKFLNRKGELS